MNRLLEFKTCEDDFEVSFEALPVFDLKNSSDERKNEISKNMVDIDARIQHVESEVSKLNVEIDRLTNHADGLDYAAAVTCGVITGLIDSIVVGAWNFEKAKAKSNKEMNEKIEEFAKQNGYEGDGLKGAVIHLEKKFKLPGDHEWSGNAKNVSAGTHHLDDFCHHPTVVGLICNVIVQFTGSATYVDRKGNVTKVPVTVNEYGKFVGKNPVTKLFAGVINWFFQVAQTMANAKGHWMSDMAGSKSRLGGGAGLPGSFMSMLKELSALPVFKDSDFGANLHKAYHNGIGTKKSQVDLGAFNALFEGAQSKFDARTEGAIKSELMRQAMPVVVNEILVRGFYFVRRFIREYKEINSLDGMRWKNVLPFKNRTISRMMTIASGTFVAVDLADAAIRSAVQNGPTVSPQFWKDFILRVNFVGIGRFVIAVGTDVGSGIKKSSLEDDKIRLQTRLIILGSSKLFYLQEGLWVEAENLAISMKELEVSAEKGAIYYAESYKEIFENVEDINNSVKRIDDLNPEFSKRFMNNLFWG